MTKKVSIFILSVLFPFCFAACGNSNLILELSHDNSTEASIIDYHEISMEQYTIGDIVLADDTVVNVENFTIVDHANLPVAVIAGYKDDGTAFGIGVHRSDIPLSWALSDTAGFSTKFTDIACGQDVNAALIGDVDGSDNWSAICAMDGDGATNVQKNYPAFHFVNTYAVTYDLDGAYISGWYMPSIAELCTVYENREEVNIALEKIYALDPSAAMDGLSTNWYWSSSQADSEDDYVWFVHYRNGYIGECPKNFTNLHVIVTRNFYR